MIFNARPGTATVAASANEAVPAQMNDTPFGDEPKAWIRFSANEAEPAGDGLFAGATGNPAGIAAVASDANDPPKGAS